MILYTYQLAHHRRLAGKYAGEIVLIDTTVKTGYVQLQPRWDMVTGVKNKTLTEEEYTRQYRAILHYWWFRDPLFFDDLIALPTVALGCYCPAGAFCHRHLCVEWLSAVTPVEYRGELSH